MNMIDVTLILQLINTKGGDVRKVNRIGQSTHILDTLYIIHQPISQWQTNKSHQYQQVHLRNQEGR